jgi:hypothetical protein
MNITDARRFGSNAIASFAVLGQRVVVCFVSLGGLGEQRKTHCCHK